MKGRRWALLSFVALALAAVAAPVPARAIECVPYARAISGIAIRGDAWTWWKNAGASYERGAAPRGGAVLVFQRSGGMVRGHVAVVREVKGPREVVIDHANWAARRGQKGRVDTGVRVRDVSAKNDWTKVRVWYRPADDFGSKVYPTYGFVYAKDSGRSARPAVREAEAALPIQNAPAQNAPAQNAPAQNAPVQNSPAQNAPRENAPGQNAPGQSVAAEAPSVPAMPARMAGIRPIPAPPAQPSPSELAPKDDLDITDYDAVDLEELAGPEGVEATDAVLPRAKPAVPQDFLVRLADYKRSQIRADH